MATFELVQGKGHRLSVEAVERNGEDVILEARVQVDRFAAHVACTVERSEVRAFRDAVADLHEALAGQAVLDRPPLRLGLEGDGTGRVRLEGEADSRLGWGDEATARMTFRFAELDQSHLPAVLAGLDAALALPETDHDHL